MPKHTLHRTFCIYCGWMSPEMTDAEYSALGIPHWCGNLRCTKRADGYIHYNEDERQCVNLLPHC
jgi:hypothetical protein